MAERKLPASVRHIQDEVGKPGSPTAALLERCVARHFTPEYVWPKRSFDIAAAALTGSGVIGPTRDNRLAAAVGSIASEAPDSIDFWEGSTQAAGSIARARHFLSNTVRWRGVSYMRKVLLDPDRVLRNIDGILPEFDDPIRQFSEQAVAACGDGLQPGEVIQLRHDLILATRATEIQGVYGDFLGGL